MNEKLPDGNKPIQIGDPSFVYHGVYHPIVWIGRDPYRPRVEMLTVKDKFQVFLRVYDKDEQNPDFKYIYRIPGGSTDSDSTKIEQAIAETNEEGLLDVKDARYSGVQYYELYKEDFVLKGGDMPLNYVGTVNEVYTSVYVGPYDKNKIEEKDLDDDMAKHGKFYPIDQVASILRPEHKRALCNCPDVSIYVKRFLHSQEDLPDIDLPNKPLPVSKPRALESSDVVVPGSGILYHASTSVISEFKPMSLDLGNAINRPGWSTFCFDERGFAIQFGIMRAIQSHGIRCEWNINDNCAYILEKGFKALSNMVNSIEFYVYQIDSKPLTVFAGNDSRLDEYVFRDSGIIPEKIEMVEIPVERIPEYLEIRTGKPQEDRSELTSFYNAILNHDYYTNESAYAKLRLAMNKGELKPGDDVELFMRDHGIEWNRNNFLAMFSNVAPVKEEPKEIYKPNKPVTEDKYPDVPTREFGVPSKRKFPLDTEEHVRSAVRFFNYVDKENEEELARRLIKKMKKFGIYDDIKVGDKNRLKRYMECVILTEGAEEFDPNHLKTYAVSAHLKYPPTDSMFADTLPLAIKVNRCEHGDYYLFTKLGNLIVPVKKFFFKMIDPKEYTYEIIWYNDEPELVTEMTSALEGKSIVDKFKKSSKPSKWDSLTKTYWFIERDFIKKKSYPAMKTAFTNLLKEAKTPKDVKFVQSRAKAALAKCVRSLRINRSDKELKSFATWLMSFQDRAKKKETSLKKQVTESFFPVFEAPTPDGGERPDTPIDNDDDTDYTNDGDEPAGDDREATPIDNEDNTDYTDTGDEGEGEPEPEGEENGEEPAGDDRPETPIDNEDSTDYTNDTGDDEDGEEDVEQTGDEATDTQEENPPEEGGDSGDVSNDTNSSTNNVVKNYILVKDFEKLFGFVEDITNTLESTLKGVPVQNKVLIQVSRNLSTISNFIKEFIQFYFKNDDYEFNLYYYTVIIQALKINLKMVEEANKLEK